MTKKNTAQELINEIDRELDRLREELINSESRSLWRDCIIVIGVTICILVAYYFNFF